MTLTVPQNFLPEPNAMTHEPIELRAELFANLKFKPHGNYVAKLEGQIIHSEITGPLISEMIQLYRDAGGPAVAGSR